MQEKIGCEDYLQTEMDLVDQNIRKGYYHSMLDFNTHMNDLYNRFTNRWKDTSLKVKLEIWREKSERIVYRAADIIN